MIQNIFSAEQKDDCLEKILPKKKNDKKYGKGEKIVSDYRKFLPNLISKYILSLELYMYQAHENKYYSRFNDPGKLYSPVSLKKEVLQCLALFFGNCL